MRAGTGGSNFFTLTLTLSLEGRGDRSVPPFTLAPLGRGDWLSSQIQQPVISVGAFA